MEKHALKGEKRTVTGKKVKNLRKQNILPANLYGKNIKSQAVQIDYKEFQKIYEKVGGSGLVELIINGQDPHPVLIQNVQTDPIYNLPLHADFYQVSLKEKVTASVPVLFVGEAPAVTNKEGVLLTVLDKVDVEALPTDLPENIELDITKLTAVDQELKVENLKIDKTKIEIKSDVTLTLVKIGSLITEEMKKQLEEEKVKAEAAAQESAAATGEAASPEPKTETAEEKPKEQPKEEPKA